MDRTGDDDVGMAEIGVDLDIDLQAPFGAQARQVGLLFIQDVQGDSHGQLDGHGAGAVAHGFHVDGAHGRQGGRVDGTDAAHAFAMRADDGRAFQDTGTAALARDFHQAEARDLAHLDAGAVLGQGVLQLLFDGAVVLGFIHVDEVDDHKAGQVAQTHLARRFLGGFHVGLERRRLDIAFLGRLARVDVDGDQGFGLVDDQVTAGLQRHDGRIDLGDQLLDAVAREQRRIGLVQLDLLGLGRHDHAHEVTRRPVAFLALDQDIVEVLVEQVADRSFDEILFLVDQGRRIRFQRRLTNGFPDAQQVVVVALDLDLGALGARRADDQAHTVRHVQRLDQRLQALAVGGVGDLARNAATTRRVRHQHAIAAGQRHVGGQGRALVAALFLDDLDQQDLAALDDFLDLVAADQVLAQPALFVGQVVAVVVVGVLFIFAIFVMAMVVMPLRLLGQFGHQFFAVGDRDLVVVGVDFVEGQEAVTIAAVFDESRLQ